jgi:hypothetical protein
MNSPTIDEIAPKVTAPVCCGCGKEVDPTFAEVTADNRLVCRFCAPQHALRGKAAKPSEGAK